MGVVIEKCAGKSKSSDVVAIESNNCSAERENDDQLASKIVGEESRTSEDLLAPDGGWGWMVAFGMIIISITTFGPVPSFSLVYGEFLESTGNVGSAATVLDTIFCISFSFSGLATNLLIKKYPMRSVGVIGAMIYSFPYVMCALVTRFYELGTIYFIQGIGLGLMLTICNTNFNAYFVKNRTKVMTASQAIIGLGCIFYPIFIEEMMNIYGFRGTILINAGLSLNGIVGMMLMHPLEWHYKLPRKRRKRELGDEIVAEEIKELIGRHKRHSIADYFYTFKNVNRSNSLASFKDIKDKESPTIMQLSKEFGSSTSKMEMRSTNHPKKNEHVLSLKLTPLNFSTPSLANLRMPIINSLVNTSEVNGDKVQAIGDKMQKEGLLHALVDMELLKNKSFINICVAASFIVMTDFMFTLLMPLSLIDSGYTQADAAFSLTICATAELASRIFLAIFTIIVDAQPKHIYFVAMIGMVITKIGFIMLNDTKVGAMLTIAAMGIVRSWLFSAQPLIFVENLKVEKFAAAYGLFAIINGAVVCVFEPLVGFIRDWTNSYSFYQTFLVCLHIIFTIPWSIELLRDWVFRKK